MLTLGEYVEINGWRGVVSAVGCLGGERYYWLIDDGVVSMIPACALEITPEGGQRG